MTKIEWTEKSWNPVVGCSITSPGCTNCYAMWQAARLLDGNPKTPHYEGTTKVVNGKPVWTGKVAMAPDHVLTEPLRRRKPTTWFVNSMGDIFHEDVPDEWIDRVFAVMAMSPQHTFQVLTKRANRMREYMTERWQPAPARRVQLSGVTLDIPAEKEGADRQAQVNAACEFLIDRFGLADTEDDSQWTEDGDLKCMRWTWPLPNVWLGVSAEDQKRADERIPHLLATPAAVRFVSAEPLLGPVDFRFLQPDDPPVEIDAIAGTHGLLRPHGGVNARLDWIIVGGESGDDARPMHPDWARSIRDQCAAAGTAFFMKQMSGTRKPLPPIPDDLMIREMPDAR